MKQQLLSFCINTARNELPYLKLLLKSLKNNLSNLSHEIIVFIDSDNQGTFEWLITQKSHFPNLKILKNTLPIPYGYARNINEMFEQASNPIVSYLQSDMVVCKDYDVEILNNIAPNTVLCSTRIEPPLHGSSGEKITYDLGTDPNTFDLESFIRIAEQSKSSKTIEYFFAPFTMYKDVWLNVGGHDTLFRRSREDTDVLKRLVLNGASIKQTWRAIVYHFTCVSSRGVDWHNPNNVEATSRALTQQRADNVEMGRYLRRWGTFNHSTSKSAYYQVVASIANAQMDINKLLFVEQFFDRIFVSDKSAISMVDEVYQQQHTLANDLLRISIKDWKTYGYIYNQQRASDRFQVGQAEGDVIVEFDLNKLTASDIETFLPFLQDLIPTAEEGSFEYGPFTIHINTIVDRAESRIKVINPTIKSEHLYTTY